MAASTAGAVKAYVEGLGLGLAVFRDRAPHRLVNGLQVLAVEPPFVIVRDGVSATANRDGDTGDPGARGTLSEQVQVSLWQRWRTPTGQVAETYGLAETLARGLRRAQLPVIGTARVHGVTRVSRTRLLEPDENLVHDAITATVHRED